jgi:peroxin-5
MTTSAPVKVSNWAADFLTQEPTSIVSPVVQSPSHYAGPKQVSLSSPSQGASIFQPRYVQNFQSMSSMHAGSVSQVQQPKPGKNWCIILVQFNDNIIGMKWEDAFMSITEAPAATASQASLSRQAIPHDDLARTAGVLLDAVSHETSEKFQNSAFLSLMRQFRNGEATVEGDQVVPRDPSSSSAAVDVKGKGKARMEADLGFAAWEAQGAGPSSMVAKDDYHDVNEWLAMKRAERMTANQETSEAQNTATAAETADDVYWRQENADYIQYWNDVQNASATRAASGSQMQAMSAQQAEWGHLQQDWDAFEATASGIKAMSNYQFQTNNPYILGSSSTRHHAAHSAGHHMMYDVSLIILSG